MKKYFLYIAPFLFIASVNAADIRYGEYSEEYNECLSKCVDDNMVANCMTEEYFRIKKGLEDIKNQIQKTPEFTTQNNTELSLLKASDAMEKYNELYCAYMKKASEGVVDKECQLIMMNSLYVDLYKINDAMRNKKQKNKI